MELLYICIFTLIILLVIIYFLYKKQQHINVSQSQQVQARERGYYYESQQYKQSSSLLTSCYVINLDKNTDRLEYISKQYESADFPSNLPLMRFPAVVGKYVDINHYLTPEAMRELLEVEHTGYRTKHHQLTRPAVGCFISHLEIYKLVKPQDVFLILEDDVTINQHTYSIINEILINPPPDWDIILLGIGKHIKNKNYIDSNNKYFKVKSFWCMFGYLINYKFASKFINTYGKIDCQIDSQISYMSDDINIYGLVNPIIICEDIFETNIQNPIKNIGIETFTYKNKILQY